MNCAKIFVCWRRINPFPGRRAKLLLNLESSVRLSGIAYGDGQFVAVGGVYGSDFGRISRVILTSADAVTWIQRHPELPLSLGGLSGIAYGNGQFVAVRRPNLSPADGGERVPGRLGGHKKP